MIRGTMSPIDLSKSLKKYKKGWVAIDKKTLKVVAQAVSFAGISAKIKNIKNIILIPASANYYGFITTNHV